MKSILILFVLFLSTGPVCSQSIEFNTKQNFIIGSLGFYPFSGLSNNELKESLPTSPNVTLEFSNFLGSACSVSASADSSTFGSPTRITGGGKITVDFTGTKPEANALGLFFTPDIGGTCIFDVLATPPPKIAASSSSTSSSGGQTSTTNSELIKNALDFETDAKNKDLVLNSSSFSAQPAINNIEKSLSSLNELSQNISSSTSSSTKKIEKNINCAITKDNKAKEILVQTNKLSFKDIAKIKSFLQSAIKCKKDIQKTLKRRKNEN